VPDASIHVSLVRAGLGLTILPESMIADAGLAGVPLRPAATFTVAFIVAADRPMSAVTRAFANLVSTTYQADEERAEG
jgi:DNA-binding transcriptional LysR family regulator